MGPTEDYKHIEERFEEHKKSVDGRFDRFNHWNEKQEESITKLREARASLKEIARGLRDSVKDLGRSLEDNKKAVAGIRDEVSKQMIKSIIWTTGFVLGVVGLVLKFT